jgi:16S rRNA (adenine1518-N6/adenine1519-N6)-dimethyltransferase
MKLSEMKRLLDENGVQLTKSLGQNFLHDSNQVRRIADMAELGSGDHVLEVGPGLGPLTEELLSRGCEVLAIEKDGRLVELLRKRFAESIAAGKLNLIHEDALAIARQKDRSWDGWKVVSNLPYSVASPILVDLAQASQPPERIVVTLQMEVAQRLLASAVNAKHYGILTLLVQLVYEPLEMFKIPASCFFPEPDVESACVSLKKRQAPILPASLHKGFSKIVKRGFSQRRKMMMKLLKADWPLKKLQTAFTELNILPTARAETVSLAQFVRLVSLLASGSGVPEEIFDVVNERDEVIGKASRSEVHRTGLMHRAVHVLVYNSRGDLFLQKRSLKKDRQPGKWDSSASGHVDAGEDYDSCAVRELREELGHVASVPLKRLFKLSASEQTDQEHVWVYKHEAEGPFKLCPEEIERGGWFSPPRIDEWLRESPDDFATAFRFLWQRQGRST